MNVNHPDHYQHPSGIECVDISRHLPHALASAFEYTWRHRRKGGVEDLRKAAWWLSDWMDHPSPYAVPESCYVAMDSLSPDPDYPVLRAIMSGYSGLALDRINGMISEAI